MLLAPGSFVNFLNLLKKKLVLKVKSETTIWVKVTEEEARRLSSLPPLLYKINEPEIQDIYLIRPLRYPDGNYYLKMGANIPNDIYFNSLPEIQQWFKTGNKNDNRPVLEKALKSIIPKISIEDVQEKRCIVCYTKHNKPYIGPVEKGLFVAAGGNGYGAMNSDTLGKIAASVLLKKFFRQGFSLKTSNRFLNHRRILAVICQVKYYRYAIWRGKKKIQMPHGTMLQYFHWYMPNDGNLWKQIKSDASRLREMGFTSIWFPPAYKGSNGGYSEGYSPYDLYDLGEFDQKGTVRTKYGTRQEYQEAIDAVHETGMQVIVDIVLNHKAGGDECERIKVVKVDLDDRTKAISEPMEIDAYTKFTFPGRE